MLMGSVNVIHLAAVLKLSCQSLHASLSFSLSPSVCVRAYLTRHCLVQMFTIHANMCMCGFKGHDKVLGYLHNQIQIRCLTQAVFTLFIFPFLKCLICIKTCQTKYTTKNT